MRRRHSREKALPLLPRPAKVYVGVNAARARGGERGLLLGARRPGRVDVLEFDPRPKDGLRELLERRLEVPATWDVVGLSLPSGELAGAAARLLRELVPGDVVLTERGASFHDGIRLVEASFDEESVRPETT